MFIAGLFAGSIAAIVLVDGIAAHVLAAIALRHAGQLELGNAAMGAYASVAGMPPVLTGEVGPLDEEPEVELDEEELEDDELGDDELGDDELEAELALFPAPPPQAASTVSTINTGRFFRDINTFI